MSAEATAALARYTPRSLTAAEWAGAGPAVVRVVAAAGPHDVREARSLAAAVCSFLATSTSWDHDSEPDLACLLTRLAVDEWVERSPLRGKSKLVRRSQLRRLVSTVEQRGPVQRASVQISPRTKAFMLAAALVPVPVVAVEAAHVPARFGGLREHAFPELLAASPDLGVLLPGGCVGEKSDGTFRDARKAVSALVRVVGVPSREVSPTSTSPSARPTHSKSVRPRTSNAAAVRDAKAAHQASQVPSTPTVSPEVAAEIAAYRPYRVTSDEWARVADVTRALITAFRPERTGRQLQGVAGHLVRFAVWVASRPDRVDPTSALTEAEVSVEGLLDEYLRTELSQTPDGSRATKRFVITRALKGMRGVRPAATIGYQPIRAPYSSQEVAAFVLQALNQPTATKRRTFSAVLALAVGAGLSGSDQRGISPRDIHEVDLGDGASALLIEVQGNRARTVAMSDQFRPLLEDALRLHREAGLPDDAPLHGGSAERRDPTSPVLQNTVVSSGEKVDVEVARLRSTWLVAAMNASVPLATLMRAAGLQSARSFADLLPYCQEPNPDDVAAVLAAVDPAMGQR